MEQPITFQVRFDVPVPGLVELSAEAFCRLLNKPGAGFEHVDWSDTVHDAVVDDGHWWVGGERGSSCAEQYHYRKFKTYVGFFCAPRKDSRTPKLMKLQSQEKT